MIRNRIPTMKDYMADRMKLGLEPSWDRRGHEHDHNYKTIVYTSAATLVTTAGVPFQPSFGGTIVRVGAKLKGAPAGADFKVDVLIDTFSIFASTLLVVKDGTTRSQFKLVERPDFNEDSVFTIKVDTIASATGPFTLTIDYLPGDV